MAEDRLAIPRQASWLVCRAGPLSGQRYALAEGRTRIGRSPDNEIALPVPVVSLYHAEIIRTESALFLRDLGSTNGTYVDGERIEETELRPDSIIRLSNNGPEFALASDDSSAADLDLDRTVFIAPPAPAPPAADGHEAMLTDAVEQARRARAEGPGGETMRLMREVLHRAIRRSRRRSRAWIGALSIVLLLITAYGYRRIAGLKAEQASIDRQIRDIENRLAQAYEHPEELDRLMALLGTYQSRAQSLQHGILYRLGARSQEDFVTREIRNLMTEFGADAYAIPPEFVDRVKHYIGQYRGPDRPLMEGALNQYRGKVQTMRRVLEREKLPPDLAYIPVVESALGPPRTSAAGAAGPWQFTASTARAYGLRVDESVDSRLDLSASTRAAGRYLRDLILDFGAGSSVMLALAAYNIGPGKVKQAIAKTVQDPIKQRNFWYLYRVRALPAETREYVPKVFAVIVISRNPCRFGF